MKKNLLQILIAAAALLPVHAVKAQTYASGDITAISMPFMNHDSTWCRSTGNIMYDVTIDHSFVGDSVKVVDTVYHMIIFSARNTTGVTPWNIMVPAEMFNPIVDDDRLWGSVAAFQMHPTKIVSGTDTVGPIADVFSLVVTDPCEYDTISGRAYVDNNLDCTFNTGDVALSGLRILTDNTLSSPSTSLNHREFYTDYAGKYNNNIQKSWMVSYTVALPSWYYFVYGHPSCFAGSYTYTTLPHGGVDFPLLCDSVDVMSYALSPIAIRYDHDFFLEPFVSNTGCDTASGTLTLVKDPRITYNPSLSYVPATSVSGDTLRWTYTNLTNLSGSGYWNYLLSRISLTPDTSAHVGDTVCFRIYSDIPTLDIDHSNNDRTLCLPVVYSYDPNVKEVQPRGIGAPGYIPPSTPGLTYTLHFQNTGTATANDIVVLDTLDSDVDPGTLRILGASHRMEPEWVASNIVKFKFPYIFLPDSAHNEPASHGAVSFSVQLRPGLAAGTQITNTGHIYFDANPPVATNTTLNTISGTTALPKSLTGSVLVYPNPANDVVYLQGIENGTVTITDVKGSVVITQAVSGGKTAISTGSLAPGIYILKAISNEQVTTSRIIKL